MILGNRLTTNILGLVIKNFVLPVGRFFGVQLRQQGA